MLRPASPSPVLCLPHRSFTPQAMFRSGPQVLAIGAPSWPAARIRSLSSGPIFGTARSRTPSPAMQGRGPLVHNFSPDRAGSSYAPQRQATRSRDASPCGVARGAREAPQSYQISGSHSSQNLEALRNLRQPHWRSSSDRAGNSFSRSRKWPVEEARTGPRPRRLCLPPPMLAEDCSFLCHDSKAWNDGQQRESPVPRGGMVMASPERKVMQPLVSSTSFFPHSLPPQPLSAEEVIPAELPLVPLPPGEAPVWPFSASHDLLPGFASGVSGPGTHTYSGSASFADQMRGSGSPSCSRTEPSSVLSVHLEDLSRIEAPQLSGLRIPMRREDARRMTAGGGGGKSELEEESAGQQLLQSGCHLKGRQRRGVLLLLHGFRAERTFLLRSVWKAWMLALRFRFQDWELAELQEALSDSKQGYQELIRAHHQQSKNWEALRSQLRESKQKVQSQEEQIACLSEQMSQLHKASESSKSRHSAGASRCSTETGIQTEPSEIHVKISGSGASTTVESHNNASRIANHPTTTEVISLKRHAAWLEQQLASIDQECDALTEALVQQRPVPSPGKAQAGMEVQQSAAKKLGDGNLKVVKSPSSISSKKDKSIHITHSAVHSASQSPVPRRLLSPSPSPKLGSKANKMSSPVARQDEHQPHTPPMKPQAESPPFTPPFTPQAYVRAAESPLFTPLSDSLSSVSSIGVHKADKLCSQENMPSVNFGLSQLQQMV